MNFIIKNFFKSYAYLTIIRCYISRKLYKLLYNFYPDHIMNIKVIDTQTNSVYIHGNNINTLMNFNSRINNTLTERFYVISIWNKNKCAGDYYILNEAIFNTICKLNMTTKNMFLNNDILERSFIRNVREYCHKYIDNDIYSIIISNKDVTHIFEKYRTSISIPNNVTAHALYLYYCYKYHIQPIIQQSSVTYINYDLDEFTITYNNFIRCD